ncbi:MULTISPECIES: hypothetical protein [Natrialbaceae]|uniref:hypothetical protein n=1 Tax=Natrialbaceae TaxID=1644061 RepID=UPI00207D51CF|nr:hypothetical protein [Natronococcus sp. CG52]
MTHTNWRPDPNLETKRGREVWDHRAPHDINDDEVDGEVEFSEEVLAPFIDDEDGDD